MSNEHLRWASYTHSSDANPPTPAEVRILRRYVENFDSHDMVAIIDTACAIMSLCDEFDNIGEWNDMDKGERVSWLFWDVGMDMPQHQRAILMLVNVIRELPFLERTEQQIRAGWFRDKLREWRDLEAFVGIWTYYMDDAYDHDKYCLEDDVQGNEGWLRLNSFHANSLALFPPDENTRVLTELDRAFKVIMFALENEPWINEPGQSPRTTLNVEIHALTPFIRISGHILFRFIDKKDLGHVAASKFPGSELWTGGSMFSMDRWDFWKERLRWISEQTDLWMRTREDARGLEQTMLRIEQENSD